MWNKLAIAVCCALLLSGVSAGDNVQYKTQTPQESAIVIPTASEPALNTTTSTTAKPTPPTQKPTTTTTKPTTTSAKPTTTPASSTTHAPPAPTPTPDPTKGKWNITNGNDTVIVQMAAQLVITYNVTTPQNVSTVAINIPSDNKTLVTGNFTPNEEAITLSWKSKGSENNSVTIGFKKSNTTYSLSHVDVSIDSSELPNRAENTTLKLMNKQQYFNTTLNYSYRCVRLQTFNLTTEDKAVQTGHMKVSDLHFQAFKTDKNTGFGLAEDCAFDTSDVVPIAVGLVLAGLVVLVLAGYLISRRRSQAQGYVSM